MRDIPLWPVLMFFAFFISIYLVLIVATFLTVLINTFAKNKNIDESLLERFSRLNREYFYTMFKKGYKSKYEDLPDWIRWLK